VPKRFCDEREERVDHWCIHTFGEHPDWFGLPPGEANVPSPREVPTRRADVAYQLARAYLVGLEAKGPGKIDANDSYDNQYFTEAVYADVLVTSDRNFHRIAQEAGDCGLKLQSNHEWARAFVEDREQSR